MGELYGGLDVSDKLTHLCVRDGAGALVWRGRCASEAEVIATTLRQRAPGLRRAVIETGPWSGWLVPRLREHGLPADCICARHAKRVLAAQGPQVGRARCRRPGTARPYRPVPRRARQTAGGATDTRDAGGARAARGCLLTSATAWMEPAPPAPAGAHPPRSGEPAARAASAVSASGWARSRPTGGS